MPTKKKPTGNPVGKPLKFKTAKELEDVIEEYFNWCDNRIQHIYSPKMEKVIEVIDPAPYTMSGLARRIGLSRQALIDYEHRDEYLDAIKAARSRVHEDVETRLMEKQATGAIFNLKNNFGWKDQSQQDIKVENVTPILGGASKDTNALPSNNSNPQAPQAP